MISQWIGEAKNEWKQNARLRLGALAIACLLVVYEISGLSLVRAGLSTDYSAKLGELSRIRSISKEDSWSKRAAGAKILHDALQAEIPATDSVGLGQATFQGFIRKVVAGFGPRLNIAMDSPAKVDGMDDYWKFPAQISGPIDANEAIQLLRQIESRKDLMAVESLQLSMGESAYLNVRVVAYYRVKPGGATNAAP